MSFVSTVRAPANIAFIKYWGKKPSSFNLATNDSLSMTLKHCCTQTQVSFTKDKDHNITLNQTQLTRNHPNGLKIFTFLDYMQQVLGTSLKFSVVSTNSFPTGSGIASSASGFAALSIATIATATRSQSWEELSEFGWTPERIAQYSRRGSGSSCRSLFGGLVQWSTGDREEEQTVKPLYDQNHWELADTIAIISSEEKKRSSSKAHLSALSSPLFKPRLFDIDRRMAIIKEAFDIRDLSLLGPILEQEALEMHAIIMSAQDAFSYLDQVSLDVICALRRWRHEGTCEAYFTIDAGPNIHIISAKDTVGSIISHFAEEFPNIQLIKDTVGPGPRFDQSQETEGSAWQQ